MKTLIWLREDLRIADNTALYYAAQQQSEGLIAVFCITPQTWLSHDVSACRVDFTLRGLRALQTDLNALHIPLLILSLNTFNEIPHALLELCKRHQVNKVFWNNQYEVNELQRDHAVQQHLQTHEIQCYRYHDQTIIHPELIKTQQGSCYTVFTPYKKAWQHYWLNHNNFSVYPSPTKQKPLSIANSIIPENISGFMNTIDPKFWPAGESIGLKYLDQFFESTIDQYHAQRDFPAIRGTSRLSPYLASGMISTRTCLHALLKIYPNIWQQQPDGASTWLNELIWREFYKYILFHFPRISKNKPFKLTTDQLPWLHDEKIFSLWQRGQTGFPIVDAAMRQLLTTGWMHNRLRMIVAMFLTKLLWIDWRWGEKYFMQNLIDGDLAANNGGWQWCASTGTDAVPYFRIFNPTTQSKKFDPNGKFIRHYCPELASLTDEQIHAPYDNKKNPLKIKLDYPKPIIDYSAARANTLSIYEKFYGKGK